MCNSACVLSPNSIWMHHLLFWHSAKQIFHQLYFLDFRTKKVYNFSINICKVCHWVACNSISQPLALGLKKKRIVWFECEILTLEILEGTRDWLGVLKLTWLINNGSQLWLWHSPLSMALRSTPKFSTAPSWSWIQERQYFLYSYDTYIPTLTVYTKTRLPVIDKTFILTPKLRCSLWHWHNQLSTSLNWHFVE